MFVKDYFKVILCIILEIASRFLNYLNFNQIAKVQTKFTFLLSHMKLNNLIKNGKIELKLLILALCVQCSNMIPLEEQGLLIIFLQLLMAQGDYFSVYM